MPNFSRQIPFAWRTTLTLSSQQCTRSRNGGGVPVLFKEVVGLFGIVIFISKRVRNLLREICFVVSVTEVAASGLTSLLGAFAVKVCLHVYMEWWGSRPGRARSSAGQRLHS